MGYSIGVALNKGDNEQVKGFASVIFDKSFKVCNIGIVDGKHGLFVSMPRFKGKDKNGNTKYTEVCHPITKEFRKALYDDIINTFHEAEASEAKFAKFESQEIKDAPKIEVRAFPLEKEGTSLKGLASVVLNGEFTINNLPIREGTSKDGFKKAFVAMPAYKSHARNNDFRDICYPTTKELSGKLNTMALEAIAVAKAKGEVSVDDENPFENGTFDNRSVKEMANKEEKKQTKLSMNELKNDQKELSTKTEAQNSEKKLTREMDR